MPVPGSEPDISFVVPTFRRPDALRVTLETLLRVDYPAERMEIVVVDDADEKRTREAIASLSDRSVEITYLGQSSSGVATARNRGARAATDYFCSSSTTTCWWSQTTCASTSGRENASATAWSTATGSFRPTPWRRWRPRPSDASASGSRTGSRRVSPRSHSASSA